MSDELTPSSGVDDSPLGLAEIMDGKGIPFEVSGRRFFIRQPTTEEYDDAANLQNLVVRKALATPEIAELKSVPPSDDELEQYDRMIKAAEAGFKESEIDGDRQRYADRAAQLRRVLEKRTLADEIAEGQGILARDRWLTARLLCDVDGKPIFDTTSKGFKQKWDRLSMEVKNSARPVVWAMLGLVQTLPFE